MACCTLPPYPSFSAFNLTKSIFGRSSGVVVQVWQSVPVAVAVAEEADGGINI